MRSGAIGCKRRGLRILRCTDQIPTPGARGWNEVTANLAAARPRAPCVGSLCALAIPSRMLFVKPLTASLASLLASEPRRSWTACSGIQLKNKKQVLKPVRPDLSDCWRIPRHHLPLLLPNMAELYRQRISAPYESPSKRPRPRRCSGPRPITHNNSSLSSWTCQLAVTCCMMRHNELCCCSRSRDQSCSMDQRHRVGDDQDRGRETIASACTDCWHWLSLWRRTWRT